MTLNQSCLRSAGSPRALWCVAALLTATALQGPARAQDEGPTDYDWVEVTAETQDAIDSGLRFLANAQLPDGSWERGGNQIAVTGLCGLAMLATGSTPEAGPYAREVEDAVRYLLNCQVRSGRHAGLIGADPAGNMIDSRPMYGHGYALLFLAECYGMSGRSGSSRGRSEDRLKRAIRAACELCARTQSKDGGWYYGPDSTDDEGSVTITQVQALRAARNGGIHVERAVIDKAIQYVRDSQDGDGGIRYTVRSGRSSVALTVAGLSVLFQSGDYSSPHVMKAAGYVRRHLDVRSSGHFEYTHFYAAQALYQLGGIDWQRYYPDVRDEVLRRRALNGSWSSSYGATYGTAMSLLVLTVPFRYLPSLTR